MIAIGWFLVGALGWTLSEYLLHRFDGHAARGRTQFSREHLRHHAVFEYFAPTYKKLVIAIPAFVLAGLLVPWALVAGFAATYAAYELLHRRIHTHAPIGPYGRWARRHHFHHHFGDARVNHGVTTPIWDVVFRTYVRPDEIVVPRKLAMRWLTPETEGYRIR